MLRLLPPHLRWSPLVLVATILACSDDSTSQPDPSPSAGAGGSAAGSLAAGGAGGEPEAGAGGSSGAGPEAGQSGAAGGGGAGKGGAVGAGAGGAGAGGAGAGGAGAGGAGAGGAAAAGAGGDAGSGPLETPPGDPACGAWSFECGPDPYCRYKSDSHCGGCDVKCGAGTECINATCQPNLAGGDKGDAINHMISDGTTAYLFRTTNGLARVSAISIDSGEEEPFSALEDELGEHPCFSPASHLRRVTVGPSGQLYMLCGSSPEKNVALYEVPPKGVIRKVLDVPDLDEPYNEPGLAVAGGYLFFVGDFGIHRALPDGSGAELWYESTCVKDMLADGDDLIVASYCSYQNNDIEVLHADRPALLDPAPDRVLDAAVFRLTGSSESHHYYYVISPDKSMTWRRQLKQGGPEEVLMEEPDYWSPTYSGVTASATGLYYVKAVDNQTEVSRLFRHPPGSPHEVILPWLEGRRAEAIAVGQTHLLVLQQTGRHLVRVALP